MVAALNDLIITDLLGTVSSALTNAFPAFGLLSSPVPQLGLPLPRKRRNSPRRRPGQIRLEHPSGAAAGSLDATPAAARGLANALSSFERIG